MSRLEYATRNSLVVNRHTLGERGEYTLSPVPCAAPTAYFDETGEPFKVLSYMAVKYASDQKPKIYPVVAPLHGGELPEIVPLESDTFAVRMLFPYEITQYDLDDLSLLYAYHHEPGCTCTGFNELVKRIGVNIVERYTK